MEKQLLALCPYCTENIPSIDILGNVVQIRCRCSEDNKSMDLKDYLDYLRKHPERVYNNPEENQEEEKDKVDPEVFIADVKKANVYMENYLGSLKEQYSSVPGVKEAYEKCIELNKDIIELKQILVKNIPPYGYTNKMMHQKHAFFNFTPYIPNKNDPNSIVDYFNFFNFGTIKMFKTVKVNNLVPVMLELQDKRIAVCGESDVISIVNPANDFKVEMLLKGHTNVTPISLLQLDNGYLISQTECEGEIKIWSVKQDSYECLFTYYNNGEIWNTIPLSKNRYTFCQEDYLQIFSGVPPFSENPITYCELEDDAKAVIGIKDKDIALAMSSEALFKYDITKEITLVDQISVRPKNNFVASDICQYDNERVIFAGIDEVIVVNFETMKIEKEIKNSGLSNCTGFLRMRNDFVFGLCQFNKFFMINVKKEKVNILQTDEQLGIFKSTVQVNDNIIMIGESISCLRCFKY